MSRTSKNYLIYVLMILLLGGLIYLAIDQGDQYSHHAASQMKSLNESAFDSFVTIVKNNLHHPLATLLIQIIVVLMAVHLFNFLFKRIGQPGVIGEIVAGIVLGPSLLGKFFPETFDFIFPTESLTNLELVSQIGLILFMFFIGMELDFKMLKNKINETLVISHAGILVPFLLGVVASFWIYEEYAAEYTSFMPFALFLGISMSITAFPVLARIIQERNMSKSSVGILSIASAANDDVTAWCLLAVVIAIVKAGTVTGALYTIALTVLYIVLMFAVVRPFLKKVGEVYANKETINKLFTGFIFLVLIISSTATEILGIHALFGAFMAGVVMPPNIGFRKVMMEKVEDIALVFFLPLFFAFTGLRTEIGLINTPELWFTCLFLVVVAIAGKLGGCTIAARLVGENWKDSLTIGTLMNTRGLMELVALNIGYEMGVLPPSIFVILVLMAIVTTFMTTPILHFIDYVFVNREERLSLKRKLLLCFGRPDSGSNLLYIYHLLFGEELRKKQIIAAHYTIGADLSPMNAGHYEQESFVPLDEETMRLNLSVDKRYKVTDKIVQEIVRLVDKEKPYMLLLGAGSGYETDKLRGTSLFSLFRDKVKTIVEQIDCVVGVFVNRGYQRGETTLVIGGKMDAFMLEHLERIAEKGNRVKLFVFAMNDETLLHSVEMITERYPEQVDKCFFSDFSQLIGKKRDGLLVISEAAYKIIVEDSSAGELPSLLIVKDRTNNSNGEYSDKR